MPTQIPPFNWHLPIIACFGFASFVLMLVEPQMDVRMETSSQVEISVNIVMPSGNFLSVKQPYWIAWDDDQLQANSLELELMLWVEDGNQWDLIELELAHFRAVLGQWHEVECLGLESGRTYIITGASGRINWTSVFEA